MQKSIEVILPQSQANSEAARVLPSLLGQHANLSLFRSWKRLSGGYGPCSLFLGVANFSSTVALNPWIVKFGPVDEIQAEHDALQTAKGFVPAESTVPHVATFTDNEHGAIIFDFIGYQNQPPTDFEAVLKQIAADEASKAVSEVIARWSGTPTWRSSNITKKLADWATPKLEQLPDDLKKLASTPTINSPDFGAAYANPIYYLRRGLKRLEHMCPFAFTHGDLNLRNILFRRDNSKAAQTDSPIFIDFRHASIDQYAIVDYAKLESCLRYQLFGALSDSASVTQAVAFLEASRGSLALVRPPEALSDKWLQELWRTISMFRGQVVRLCSGNEGGESCYWATLVAYALSNVTYDLPIASRNLAFLDAAAILTARFQTRDPSAQQCILRVHSLFSPVVSDAGEAAVSAPLLTKAIGDGRTILVLGSSYGRARGFEPLGNFVQNVYRELLGEEPPSAATETNLEVLSRRVPRTDVVKAIRDRSTGFGENPDGEVVSAVKWAAVLNLHFTDELYRRLRDASPHMIRIDSLADAVKGADSISEGYTPYFAILGDALSAPGEIVLDASGRKVKDEVLQVIKRNLERRQQPLSLLFWKCEDASPDWISSFRGEFSAGMSVPIDAFFVSDQSDPQRDSILNALGIHRVSATLSELLDGAERTPPTAGQLSTQNIEHQSHGLLFGFERAQALVPDGLATSSSFLLGGTPTVEDLRENRVVRRSEILNRLLPAVRVGDSEQAGPARPILVQGRAGSGVTTVLTNLAHAVEEELKWPVFVFNSAAWVSRDSLATAGQLLGEESAARDTPVVLIVEPGAWSGRDLGSLLSASAETRGEVVPVVGGRRDIMERLQETTWAKHGRRFEVDDSLTSAEWELLARILRSNGFALAAPVDELAKRLEDVGVLLPAIYEATDGKNRKFREIVAYEYNRYSSNRLVQRAYRLICYLGAFDRPISQFWLLKALGNRSTSDTFRILDALAEDIVSWPADDKGHEVLLRPRHRIIAEEVLSIAVPDHRHRLADWRELIKTANMSSQREGNDIAEILYHKGPFISWVRTAFKSNSDAAKYVVESLYEDALANTPLHPDIEITLRQHFALTLRYHRKYDEAMREAKHALALDPDNIATTHVLGLVHESRATRAWRNLFRKYGDKQARQELLTRALGNEADALEFFRQVREQQPSMEYGYIPEARYYNRKHQIVFGKTREIDRTLRELQSDSKIQIYSSLALLRSAEARIPKERRDELPRAKSEILATTGDFDSALENLEREIDLSSDPIHTNKLLRAAAALSAEAGRWGRCRECSEALISAGEHDAGTYLIHDMALQELKAPIGERWRWIQESADTWNRRDVKSLLLSAEIRAYRGDWDGALDSLRRADDAANADGLSIYERERIVHVLRDDIYSATEKLFTGEVNRLWKPYEGLVSFEKSTRGIFFRVGRELQSGLKTGVKVRYRVALRVRGLRAVGVELLQ